ncbi:MAG: ABC transporter substrate-binding protein [Betaproteobacteria bacterium]|nr:ABC transporter substrate-binding protein [Betaproteobacteria bacterium]
MPPADAVRELAPGGTLRAAINYGNPILANRQADGTPAGVSVDLARELAQRLGVKLEVKTYTSAGKVTDALKSGEWDIAFYALDPVRAADTGFTKPYVVIEGAYAVPQASQIQRNEQVDRDGVRVAVGRGSAYDLFLSRELKHASLVRAPTSPAVVDTLVAEKLEVAAGVRQQLEADARRLPGVRLLPGRFMLIQQAMAMPKADGKVRAAGLAYLSAFVEEMKSTGFVAAALQRHHIEGVSIAP